MLQTGGEQPGLVHGIHVSFNEELKVVDKDAYITVVDVSFNEELKDNVALTVSQNATVSFNEELKALVSSPIYYFAICIL